MTTLFDVEPVVHGSAVLRDDEVYRYSLTRWWSNDLPLDLWLMCNPSTANHIVNDATITRCIGFSRRFGSGGFAVANAYAYRATKPAAMWAAQRSGVDIVGPENDEWISTLACAAHGRVIVAWGGHPKPDRVAQVIDIVRSAGREPLCLGTTKDGQPRHPLRLANATELEPWSAAA